jgi:hypothetical protein
VVVWCSALIGLLILAWATVHGARPSLDDRPLLCARRMRVL